MLLAIIVGRSSYLFVVVVVLWMMMDDGHPKPLFNSWRLKLSIMPVKTTKQILPFDRLVSTKFTKAIALEDRPRHNPRKEPLVGGGTNFGGSSSSSSSSSSNFPLGDRREN
jgi:hypothetical protein